MKKQARAPTSAVEYVEQARQFLKVCVHSQHIPGVLHAKEGQKCGTHEHIVHRDGRICDQEHQKTEIMDYNTTKGGAGNLDKLVTAAKGEPNAGHL